MIAGLRGDFRVDISIGSKVVNNVAPKERDIAMVFQSYALYPHLTVEANMGFSLKLAKAPKEQTIKRVQEAAQILGLGTSARPISEKSIRRPASTRRDGPGHREPASGLPV
jgi:multiple sugar transport system ATP-binding protein